MAWFCSDDKNEIEWPFNFTYRNDKGILGRYLILIDAYL